MIHEERRGRPKKPGSHNVKLNDPLIRENVRAYLHKHVDDRPPLKPWLRSIRMNKPTFERIRGWIECEDKLHELELPNIKSVMARLGEAITASDPIEDSAVILDDAMFREGRTGNKAAAELWYRRQGLLEKEQAKGGNVNIAAIALAIRIDGNGVAGKGVATVQGRVVGRDGELDSGGLTLLRPELREDSGPGEAGDDSVPAVGSPDTAAETPPA